MDPKTFFILCQSFTAHAVALQKQKHCIIPLRSAIGRYVEGLSNGIILPAHAELFRMCLLTKCYSAADEIFSSESRLDVDPGITGTTVTDVLLYCYYGGMLHVGKRRYQDAMELFLTAISIPSYVVNAITIAAAKKLILTAILHLGYVPALPKETPQPVNRAIKSQLSVYLEFAKLASLCPSQFGSTEKTMLDNMMGSKGVQISTQILDDQRKQMDGRNTGNGPSRAGTLNAISRNVGACISTMGFIQDLEKFVDSNMDTWKEDGNAGLVQCILDKHAHRRIQDLTRVFSDLSMVDIAKKCDIESEEIVERTILSMMKHGFIRGGIRQSTSSVHFASDGECCQNTHLVTNAGREISDVEDKTGYLQNLMSQCMEISDSVSRLQHVVHCDKAFLIKSHTELDGNSDRNVATRKTSDDDYITLTTSVTPENNVQQSEMQSK